MPERGRRAIDNATVVQTTDRDNGGCRRRWHEAALPGVARRGDDNNPGLHQPLGGMLHWT